MAGRKNETPKTPNIGSTETLRMQLRDRLRQQDYAGLGRKPGFGLSSSLKWLSGCLDGGARLRGGGAKTKAGIPKKQKTMKSMKTAKTQ